MAVGDISYRLNSLEFRHHKLYYYIDVYSYYTKRKQTPVMKYYKLYQLHSWMLFLSVIVIVYRKLPNYKLLVLVWVLSPISHTESQTNTVSHGSSQKTVLGNPGWSGNKNFDSPQKVAQWRANTKCTWSSTFNYSANTMSTQSQHRPTWNTLLDPTWNSITQHGTNTNQHRINTDLHGVYKQSSVFVCSSFVCCLLKGRGRY